MTTPLTLAEVQALPSGGSWHVSECDNHRPGGAHYSASYPPPTCLRVRDEGGARVPDIRPVLDLQAAAPALRTTALALHKYVEEACFTIAGVLDRDQIEPLPASLDRLICALADAREKLEVYEAGGSWPSDLGEPVRCGTLGVTPPTAPTGFLEWKDGRPVRPTATEQEKT